MKPLIEYEIVNKKKKKWAELTYNGHMGYGK